MDQKYRLIDGDAHVNEPPTLWSERVPAEFRDRAPRMEHFDEGDAWVLEGVTDPINFGLNASAGMDAGVAKQWVRWEDVRKGGYDPAARLEEMDRDGVDAEVLYPTPRLSHSFIASKDADFHLAMVRAYNDWLVEFVSHDPKRLGAVIIVPNRGVDEAVAEVKRLADKPGVVAALIGCYPHGDLEISPDDDPVWEKLAEVDLPAAIHVAMIDSMPVAHAKRYPGDVRFYDAPKRMLQLIYTGVFDRVPDLKVVFAEVDCGWVPYFREQMDDKYLRLRSSTDFGIKHTPGEYLDKHVGFTYIMDHHAVQSRHQVGLHNLMWSSDFPHMGSDWPHSWKTIQADFANVPGNERELILSGNAQRFYRFGG